MEAYIIFGMGPAGLFLARQLKRHSEASIIAIGKKDDIGRYSNVLARYYDTEDKEGVKKAVEEVIGKYTKVVPFVCSDQYLSLFFEQWPEAFEVLDFSHPSHDLLTLFSDKERLMDYCLSLGMRVPKGEMLSSATFNGSPLVIKPLVKRGVSKMGKITVIRSAAALDKYKNGVLAIEENLSDYLVQPYIEGDNRYEYGYGGFFENGKPLVDICFYQLRQYPQGVSCFTLEVKDEKKRKQIKGSVKPFIVSSNYSGFLQFDVKEDKNTGLLYVLDANPRPWGSVSMLSSHLKSGGALWEQNGNDILCQWQFPIKEVFSFKNKLNVSYSNIRSMKKGKRFCKVIDLFDRKDMKPFLMQPIVMFMKLFK